MINRFKDHVQCLKHSLKPSELVLSIVKFGYVILCIQKPSSVYLKNNRSAFYISSFVLKAITDLIKVLANTRGQFVTVDVYYFKKVVDVYYFKYVLITASVLFFLLNHCLISNYHFFHMFVMSIPTLKLSIIKYTKSFVNFFFVQIRRVT